MAKWRAPAVNPLATTAMMGGLLGGLIAPGWAALRAPVPGLAESWSRWVRIAAWGALVVQWTMDDG